MAIIKEFDQHIYLTNEGKYLKVAENQYLINNLPPQWDSGRLRLICNQDT